MNKQKILGVAAALSSLCIGLSPAMAQDLFQAEINTRSVVTNDSGGLSYGHYGNKQIIAEAATAAGLTNLSELRLVYNKTADDVEVVMGTNNTVISMPLTFSGGVSLSKTNGMVVERLAWVFLGTNTAAAGTLRATEFSHFDTNSVLTHFSLIGQLQFAGAAEGTNGATVYSGNISAGPFEHLGRGEGDERDEAALGRR